MPSAVRCLVLAAAATLIAVPAAAATIVVDSGLRIQTMSFTNGIFGQSFLAPGTDLLSVGVQFATLNPTGALNSVTVAVRQGEGLGGMVLGSSTFVPNNVGRFDPFVFTDIDFTGVTLVPGAAYTITLLNNGSGTRNGIVFGPNSPTFGPDPYPDGRLIFTGNFGSCNTQAVPTCDLNFRVVTAAEAVIPEPATWGLMIAGFGLIGFAARRRVSITG